MSSRPVRCFIVTIVVLERTLLFHDIRSRWQRFPAICLVPSPQS